MLKDAETPNDAHPADAADVPVLLSFIITEAERNIPAIIDALKLKLVSVSYVCLITFIKSRHERLTFLTGRLTELLHRMTKHLIRITYFQEYLF